MAEALSLFSLVNPSSIKKKILSQIYRSVTFQRSCFLAFWAQNLFDKRVLSKEGFVLARSLKLPANVLEH